MSSGNLLGLWIRRFLLEHLIGERNLSRNTQTSYRDTLVLLLPFVSSTVKKPVDRLTIDDVSPSVIRLFLQHLEQDRSCSVATRNQRLCAIHSLARFIATRMPEEVIWCSQIRAIPFKRTSKAPTVYLEKSEIDALLQVPDRRTAQGLRDYAVLLFLYNSGARADEAARLIVSDLSVGRSPSVRILGKGGKVRFCPLWASTATVLTRLVAGRGFHEPVFLNRLRQRITRFGIHGLVKRCVSKAGRQQPSLRAKKVSAHVIRHTTAVHLLRAGVDINTIRAWLGHVSLDTTHIYAEIDLEMKAKALAHVEIPEESTAKQWRARPTLMAFLKAL